MKIDFEDIITKANTRKELLQEMTGLLDEFPAYYDQFLRFFAYLNNVAVTFRDLDDEGKNMLPKDIKSSLICIHYALKAMEEMNYRSTVNGVIGFQKVNQTIKEHS